MDQHHLDIHLSKMGCIRGEKGVWVMKSNNLLTLKLYTEVLVTQIPILNFTSCPALLLGPVEAVNEKEIGGWIRETSTVVTNETKSSGIRWAS